MAGQCCSGYVCAILLLFVLNVFDLMTGAGLSVYALWLGPVERAPVFVWAPMLCVGGLFIVTAALTWCVLQVAWCTPLLTVCAVFDVILSTATVGLGIALLVHHETLAEWLEKLGEELGSGSESSEIPDIPSLILQHIGNEAWRDTMATILFIGAAVQLSRAVVGCYLHGRLNEQYYRSRLQAGKFDGTSCCGSCGKEDGEIDEVFRDRKFSDGEAALGYDDQVSYRETHNWAQSGSALPSPSKYSPMFDTPAGTEDDDYRNWTQRYVGQQRTSLLGRHGMPKVEPRRDPEPSVFARDGSLPDDSWMLGGTYKLEEKSRDDDSGCSVQ
jgi:hypothetical protein